MKKGLSKKFEGKGYTLKEFSNSDPERIGPDCVYKYYAAKNGRIIKKLTTLKDAALWIEFK